mmetsp:Transcript_21695/g.32921  ORF Transcript_21695/g.32921 Transcript_21695/m.32921 type:complete len:125 (-) Transcript_21695:113-487(-)
MKPMRQDGSSSSRRNPAESPAIPHPIITISHSFTSMSTVKVTLTAGRLGSEGWRLPLIFVGETEDKRDLSISIAYVDYEEGDSTVGLLYRFGIGSLLEERFSLITSSLLHDAKSNFFDFETPSL